MKDGKHYIVVNFKDTEVGKKYERPVWDGFRIWESVKYPIPLNIDIEKLKRTVNSIGHPPFNILTDWLMDFSTISAGQLGRTDWENFKNLVLIHVPTCRSKCWYCFNDAWENKCECDWMSSIDIVDKFLEQQKRNSERNGKQNNVIRLSGGEPFMQPLLIRDLALEIEKRNDNSIFLWLDTNLFEINAKRKKKEVRDTLDALKKLDNKLAIHACFHGVSDESIRRITGLNKSIDELITNYKILEDEGLNVYPRFNPCSCTPDEAEKFFIKLYETDETIPLKLYLGIVELYYKAAKDRMNDIKNLIKKDTRTDKPYYYSPQAVIYWWNKIMQLAYGVGYGVLPRHIAVRYPKEKNPFLEINSEELKKKIAKRKDNKDNKDKSDKPDKEVLFISKGSFKEIYAMKVLEALALPKDSFMNVEYSKKYVEPNLYQFLDIFPEIYRNKDVLIVATHPQERNRFHMTYLRWGKLEAIENTPVSTNVKIKLSFFPYYEDKYERLDGVKNHEEIADYLGERNLPVNGYFLQLLGYPSKKFPMINKNFENHQDEAFFQVIKCLNESGWKKDLNKNIYYRIASIKKIQDKKDIEYSEVGRLIFTPGDEVEIKLVSYNPNIDDPGFPTEDEAILKVAVNPEENIKVVSNEIIRLSKFGQHKINLRLKGEDIEFKGEIMIKPKEESDKSRIFETILPFTCYLGE